MLDEHAREAIAAAEDALSLSLSLSLALCPVILLLLLLLLLLFFLRRVSFPCLS
jgi:hypothetical protein